MKWWDLLSRLAQAAMGQWAERLARDLEFWRWQLFQSVLFVMLASVCGLSVLMLVAVLVALTFWDTHRLEALGVLVLVYTVLTAGLVRRAARCMAPPMGPSAGRRSPCAACGGSPSRHESAGCGH